MTAVQETDGYLWEERRSYCTGAPVGKVWSVREMVSYSTAVESFAAHLLAMAKGLDRACIETYDHDPEWSGSLEDDNFGVFVVGLRDATDDDRTAAQRRAEERERRDRQEFERLKAKFEASA